MQKPDKALERDERETARWQIKTKRCRTQEEKCCSILLYTACISTYETFMDMLYGGVNSLFRNAFYILILCSIVVLSLFDCCASRL